MSRDNNDKIENILKNLTIDEMKYTYNKLSRIKQQDMKRRIILSSSESSTTSSESESSTSSESESSGDLKISKNNVKETKTRKGNDNNKKEVLPKTVSKQTNVKDNLKIQKITESTRNDIYNDYLNGLSYAKIGKKYNISNYLVGKVLKETHNSKK
jgi:hypothetical protein